MARKDIVLGRFLKTFSGGMPPDPPTASLHSCSVKYIAVLLRRQQMLADILFQIQYILVILFNWTTWFLQIKDRTISCGM